MDKSIDFIANNESVDPDKPWRLYLAFGACHAPHHVPKEWIDKYKGRFDMGWDKYRETVLARQKQMGIVPESAVHSPMLEGIEVGDEPSDEKKRLFARMAEVYAGFLFEPIHRHDERGRRPTIIILRAEGGPPHWRPLLAAGVYPVLSLSSTLCYSSRR